MVVATLTDAVCLSIPPGNSPALNRNKMQNQAMQANGEEQMKKELHVTVDFFDDNFFTGVRMNIICQPKDVDRKLEYFASLGVNRVDWMWDTWNLLYREPFGGEMNRLAYAAKKARALGMQVHALLKPFETGVYHMDVPSTFPRPAGMQIWQHSNGICPWIDPFVLEHPEMCFRRRPGPADPGGAVKTIKLVKVGAEPTRIRKEHLEIWTGSENGRLAPCGGAFGFSVAVEKRVSFKPADIRQRRRILETLEARDCLVITLEGLALPDSERYIDVRCSLKGGEGDFWNLPDDLVELYNGAGERIPSSPGWRESTRTCTPAWLELMSNFSEYGRHPEVRAFIQDPEKVRAAGRDYYRVPALGPDCLDGGGTSCVARGVDEYMPILNPAYPEVRDYWAGVVEECIESGVAGVNIRVSGHSTIMAHQDRYGFNEPVLAEKSDGSWDMDKLQTGIGDGYTELLRRAKETLMTKGLPLSVHVNSAMVLPEGYDRSNLHNMPPNVEWQWQRWIEEGIADIVCLKHAFLLDSEARLELFIDRVTGVASRCGVPVINIMSRGAKFDGPNDHVERQMEVVMRNPRLSAFNLYESAGITRFNDKGEMEGSPQIAALVARHFPGLVRG